MGSEDLFHKRRARSNQDLRRRVARRESYERALIVCEGSKTEPNYFQEWRNRLRLTNASIEIVGDCDSDPLGVVNHGINEAQRDGEYDRVFCVFDRDQHTSYDDALLAIGAVDADVFTAIRSVPCFEYWLLLHYEYSSKGMTSAEALAAIRHHVPEYQKNTDGLLALTVESVATASKRARAVRSQGRRAGFDSPYTNVDILVRYLQRLKS